MVHTQRGLGGVWGQLGVSLEKTGVQLGRIVLGHLALAEGRVWEDQL